MRLRALAVAALAAVSITVFAQKEKKASVPAVFGLAQFAYVQGEFGDIHWPGLCSGDRQAIVDTENAIRSWDRYQLTSSRDEAELVFIVHKGRPGVGSESEPNSPVSMAGPTPERSPCNSRSEHDQLEVRRMRNGHLSSPIWSRAMMDGLDGPRVPLVELLEKEVEKEYPKP